MLFHYWPVKVKRGKNIENVFEELNVPAVGSIKYVVKLKLQTDSEESYIGKSFFRYFRRVQYLIKLLLLAGLLDPRLYLVKFILIQLREQQKY